MTDQSERPDERGTDSSGSSGPADASADPRTIQEPRPTEDARTTENPPTTEEPRPPESVLSGFSWDDPAGSQPARPEDRPNDQAAPDPAPEQETPLDQGGADRGPGDQPGVSQPESQQPQYQQPQYQQPGYQQPGYQQPAAAPGSGAVPYGQPGYGQSAEYTSTPQPYAYGPPPLSPEAEKVRSAAVLWTILNGVAIVVTANLFSIVGVILAAVAIGKARDDAPGARRLVRWSWILFTAWYVLAFIATILFIIFIVAAANASAGILGAAAGTAGLTAGFGRT